MADQQVYYDLEFHFSSGERVAFTVMEGRDAIDESQAGIYRATIMDGVTERTIVIHKDKVDAVESTKRVVDKGLATTEEAQRKWQE